MSIKLFIYTSILATIGGGCYGQAHYKESEKPPFDFASYYSDHMVLQRAPHRAGIWGYAPPSQVGNTIEINVAGEFAQRYYSVIAREGPFDSQAVWSVTLDAFPEGGPYVITASLRGYKPLVMKNIMFGDVWLCSGQSNMVFTMIKMFEHSLLVEEGFRYPELRLMTVQRVQSPKPLYDLKELIMGWMYPGLTDPQTGDTIRWQDNFSAVCFMFGRYLYDKLGVPIGLIDDSWGGTPVECWSSPETLATCGLQSNGATAEEYEKLVVSSRYDTGDPNNIPPPDSSLWNAMIHPLLNMTIKGAIWYQGESNTNYHTSYYACTFPAMIKSWRTQFSAATNGQVSDEFPFGFVQIGPNINPTEELAYPTIRWHQMGDDVTRLPLNNMFMAVAMDLTDMVSTYDPVHIRDKKTVAERLSRAALNLIYSEGPKEVMYPYPTYEHIDSEHAQLLVQFLHGVVEINVRRYDGFEVCCVKSYSECPLNSTVNWIPAPIVKYNTTTIWISWAACQSNTVAAYRYTWAETPCPYHQCAIYSDYSGDPLPTFVRPLRQKTSRVAEGKRQSEKQQSGSNNVILETLQDGFN